ncbi:thioester reductase domain-containing protein [Xenorhabdus bovienii]|uniref:Thioester reductase (TE) domain-containing protein n=1 Tax=Xenorhabdus bovienii str. Intermedium TaxID=1379677 RepID=A0A077QL24_XENBV|nr:thioester reductase domain-containing protein [Xenorhabdus bovienii]MDE9454426.1 thioester reductase domain-containing protein [Xenorhabdus bovienii]MDE9480253.1 thioester reductase domain-containing protein [Xenorhabdus bovienii]MDE9551698.1 thioester reductase domain-containing protein [Xenorhabdus bovienii]MDE9554797.1 thioester reductase domain-containing protein [Xenorhabdus bovienii]MDE9563051.1 thioester reductase domain-containing protein [Xenorhabdus bovienii]
MLDHTKKDARNILLTGATGVMGGRILLEILNTTDANVYCLTREENQQQALSRLEEFLFVYDQEKQRQYATQRIIPIFGDVSKKRLGLTKDLYNELAGKIDSVIHCAANVNLVAAYSKLAPVNVQGTQNVIDFCLQGNMPILYASSFSMVGDHLYQEGFVLHETDLDVGQKFDDMDYERSKFEAEKAVHSAGKKGLKWVIVRPGNIWGDSHNGNYPLLQTKVKGLYYEMVKALVETGLTFTSEEDFDITPVDYVAKASLYAILNIEKFNGKTLNLTNPNPITFNEIVAILREFGYRINTINNNDYMEALSQNSMYRNGQPYRSVFTDLLGLFYSGIELNERAKYATQLTTELLSGSGIQCAASDSQLLFRYFNYLIECGFIASPQQQGEGAEIREVSARGGYLEQLFDADL